MSVDKKEEIKSRFLNDLEQGIEQFDAPKGLIPFIKKDRIYNTFFIFKII